VTSRTLEERHAHEHESIPSRRVQYSLS